MEEEGKEGGWQFVGLNTGRYGVICTEQDAGFALYRGASAGGYKSLIRLLCLAGSGTEADLLIRWIEIHQNQVWFRKTKFCNDTLFLSHLTIP